MRSFLFAAVILLGNSLHGFGQYLSGPTTVNPSTSHTYTLQSSAFYMRLTWNVTGGVVLSNWKSGTTYYCSVLWTTPGSQTLKASDLTLISVLNVKVNTLTPPAAPVARAASAISSTQFTASWAAVTGATSYRLDVATDAAFGAPLAGYNKLVVSTTSRAVSGLAPGATCYYRVRALNSVGASPNSNTVATTTVYIDKYHPDQQNKNFVKTETIMQAGVKNEPAIDALGTIGKATAYTYKDALGRDLQQVSVQASPTLRDVVKVFEYDQFGRMGKAFLPYTVYNTNELLRPQGTTEQASFYQAPLATIPKETQRPYSENTYDNSPLNRVISQAGAGAAWHDEGRDVKSTMRIDNSGRIYFFRYNDETTPPTLDTRYNNADGRYPAGMLTYHEQADEENHYTREYKNMFGRSVLKEVEESPGSYFQTYTVYDVVGNMRIVFPPEASAKLAEYFEASTTGKQAFLDRWTFQYRYDEYSRMVARRIPGADWVYSVYDTWDRAVLTQDGAQRTRNEWLFTKYDIFNRPVATGLYTTTRTHAQLRADLKAIADPAKRYETPAAGAVGYTLSNTFPTGITEANLLTIVYYDNYNFLTPPWDQENNIGAYTYTPVAGLPLTFPLLTSVKDKTTGSKTRILGQEKWLNAVTYYDRKYNVVQTMAENHLGGVDRHTSVVDFTGKITHTQTSHAAAGKSVVTITRKFDYDHAGRPANTWHKVNNGPFVLLTRNVYNELGQLISKKLHSTDNGINFKQHVDYRYNIRGWITHINNADLSANNPDNPDDAHEPPDYFGIDLLYNQQDPALGNSTYYDGNIGALRWSKRLGLGAHQLDEPTGQASTFSYDVMGRLTATNTFFKKAQWHPDPSRRETGLTYDRNGNISTLTRWSTEGHVQDDLNYTYNGNQLLNVTDASSSQEGFNDLNSSGSDYAYDAAGNMVADHNKGITAIQYNHLNLPQVVQNIDGEKLLFTYDAAGIKLGQQWYNAAGTLQLMYDYNGEFMYENGALQFINHEQGRVNMTGEVPVYEYTLRDHQGNTRITFTTQPRTDTWKATMEAAGYEQHDFGNYHAEANDLFDHTDAGTVYQHAHILNGGYAGQVGLTRSLAVLPGDTVRASAYAKYEDQVQKGADLQAFAAALTGAFSLTPDMPGEARMAFEALNSFGTFVASGQRDDDDTAPKGFLNILVFDKNFNLVDLAYQQVSAAYSQSGDTKQPHERLAKEVVIRQPGYVLVFLSNEGQFEQQIGFDDLELTHAHSAVIQAADYYPFGLAYDDYQQEGTLAQRWTFQNQERLTALNLGWSQFKWRNAMPELGRFFNIDPLAEKYLYNSTYAFSENKLIAHVELEGLESEWATFAGFAGMVMGITESRISNPSFSDYAQTGFNFLWSGSGLGSGFNNIVQGATQEASSKVDFALNANRQIQQAINTGGNPQEVIDAHQQLESAGRLQAIGGMFDVAKFSTNLQAGLFTGGLSASNSAFSLSSSNLGTPLFSRSGPLWEGAAKTGVQAAEYTFTKSAGKHLTDIVTKGANKGQLARPYMNSPLTIQEIMSTGKGTLDATFKGGMNWKVPGTFRGSQGIYELGINPNTNVIYHFNFVH